MIEILKILQSGDFYGAGKHVDIAKGINELDYSWIATKEKIKRTWASRKPS